MADEKAPAFQFCPVEYLLDGQIRAMTLSEQGKHFMDVIAAIERGDDPATLPAWVGKVTWRCLGRRPTISLAVKRAVYERDGGRCRRCPSTESLEYDHVIPYSKGGPSTVENIQLLCRPCNRKKGVN